MYILNFLAESATGGSSSSPAQSGLPSWIIWVVLGLLLVVMLVPGFLRSKKQKKEYEEKMARMTVGSKVKTIGLIMGEIVSMTEDTVTLKTGDADHFSYVTVEKRAVYEISPSEEPLDDIYSTKDACECDTASAETATCAEAVPENTEETAETTEETAKTTEEVPENTEEKSK